jgi:hypothetical protein
MKAVLNCRDILHLSYISEIPPGMNVLNRDNSDHNVIHNNVP